MRILNSTLEQRGLAAGAGMVAIFTVFSFRLVQLQVTDHQYYTRKAMHQNTHSEPIYARRGEILDLNGVPLAQNEPVKTVVADGSLIADSEALAKILAGPLKMKEDVLLAKLTRKMKAKVGDGLVPCPYIVLRKGLPEGDATDVAALVADARIKKIVDATGAIRFEQDFTRVYPNGKTLGHVIGYTNDAGIGMDGIEASLNNRLQGTNGERNVERDRTGRELVLYRGLDKPPEDGGYVRLTVDINIQQIVESELDAAVKQYHPRWASVVMMNPKTGDIMAMANRPTFDPNEVPKWDPIKDKGKLNPTRNISISDQVEPGSTFKIVPTSAGISEGLISLDTDIWVENGYWAWCRLKDSHGHPSLTVRNILVKSSNIGAAKIGIQLGEQRLYEYARKFGFGINSNVMLPAEFGGTVNPPDRWDKLTITRIPMGQSVAVTPLQITNAMCVIANGGVLMAPQIVREYVGDKKKLTEIKPHENWRVVSKKAANDVRDALIDVCGPKGTAVAAAVPGFKVAGKTGTAQKRSETGRMTSDAYVVSFVGFLPANDPEFVMLVMLDEPRVDHENYYGGKVAAPIFSRIAARTARYLNLQPTEPIVPPGGKITKDESRGGRLDD